MEWARPSPLGGRPLGAAGDPESCLLYVADGTAELSIIDLYSLGGTRDRINAAYAPTPDKIDDRVLRGASNRGPRGMRGGYGLRSATDIDAPHRCRAWGRLQPTTENCANRPYVQDSA